MGIEDTKRLGEEIGKLGTDVLNTQQRLEAIKNEGSIWTESGRQSIVRKCLEIAGPEIQKNLPKVRAISERLKALGGSPEIADLVHEFQEVVTNIQKALAGMAKYGDEPSIKTAKTLLSEVNAVLGKTAV